MSAPARVAGVDEAGRGPLAGPVFAAAVVLDPGSAPQGLADSKCLSPGRREQLADDIAAAAVAWAVAWADVAEIDAINILQASLLAMRRALARLALAPSHVQVDGRCLPRLDRRCSGEAIVGGDRRVAAISAASILAKVHRDAAMRRWHTIYPDYGFDRHKGYATAAHLEVLANLGPCPIHRQSFAPVRAAGPCRGYRGAHV